MAANTSPDNITYPVSTDQIAPLESVLAVMASSVQTALNNTKKNYASLVTSQAARDAMFPAPVQGNRVFRTDKGWEETYFAAFHTSTNPGGATPAGWYPTSGAVPMGRVVRSGTVGNVGSGAYTDVSGTTFWTPDTLLNMGSYATGWTAPVSGIYRHTASLASSGSSSMLAGFAVSTTTPASPNDLEAVSVSGALQGWTGVTCVLTRRFVAGETLKFWGLAGGSQASWSTSAKGSVWSVEYLRPPMGA